VILNNEASPGGIEDHHILLAVIKGADADQRFITALPLGAALEAPPITFCEFSGLHG
jgi:hypothetical protein